MHSSGRVITSSQGALYRSTTQIAQGLSSRNRSSDYDNITVLGDGAPDEMFTERIGMSSIYSSPAPSSRIWMPTDPIIFASTSRAITHDYTWSHGDPIRFGHHRSQSRTYATKPLVYKPRLNKSIPTLSDGYDAENVAVLFSDKKPVIRKPSIPVSEAKASTSVSSSKMQKPPTSATSSPKQTSTGDWARDEAQVVKEASMAAKPVRGESVEIPTAVQSGATTVQYTGTGSITTNMPAIKEGAAEVELSNMPIDEQLQYLQARAKEVEARAKAMELELQESRRERTRLEDTLRNQRSQHERIKTSFEHKIKSLTETTSDMSKRISASSDKLAESRKTTEQLQKDLELERDPVYQQRKRLEQKMTASSPEFEDISRQVQSSNSRALERKDYASYREFFTRAFTSMKNYQSRQGMDQISVMHRQALQYWRRAAERYAQYKKTVRGKDRKDGEGLVFDRMSDFLEDRLRQIESSVKELRDKRQLYHTAVLMMESESHFSRELTRSARMNTDPTNTAPPIHSRGLVSAYLSLDMDLAIRYLARKVNTKRHNLTYMGVNPDSDISQAYLLAEEFVNALKIIAVHLREYETAEWVTKQPPMLQALWKSVDGFHTSIISARTRQANMYRLAEYYKINTLAKVSKPGPFNRDLRNRLDAYTGVVYRNRLISEKHDKLSSVETSDAVKFFRRQLMQERDNLSVAVKRYKKERFMSQNRQSKKDHDTRLADRSAVNVNDWDESHLEQEHSNVDSDDLMKSRDNDATTLDDTPGGQPISLSERRRRRRLEKRRQDAEQEASSQKTEVDKQASGVVLDKANTDEPSRQISDIVAVSAATASTEATRDTDACVVQKVEHTGGDEGPIQTISATEPPEGSTIEAPALGTVEKRGPLYSSSKSSSKHRSVSASSKVATKKSAFPLPRYSKGSSRIGFKGTSPRRQVVFASTLNVYDEDWLAHKQTSSIGSQSGHTGDETAGSNPSSPGDGDSAGEPVVIPEIHRSLRFQIPQDELRKAHMASEKSGAAYWRHTLYQDPEGAKVKVHYCSKYETAERVAQIFLDKDVLGVDLEWEYPAVMGGGSIKDNVSLIQIACEERVALFHLALFRGNTVEELMPPSLRAILESANITKTGVNIKGDFTRLTKWLDIDGHGIFELSHLYKQVKYAATEPQKIDKKQVNLALQVKEMLHLPLAKDDSVRTSAWSKILSMEQVDYAASDAYAGFRLFDRMEEMRKQMVPTPPRPAFHELDQPILLGNGEPAPKANRRRVSKAVGELTSAMSSATLEESNEEAVMVRNVDLEQEDENAQQDESDDEFHSCESEASDTDDNPPPPPSHEAESQASPAMPVAPPELIKAEQWMSKWRANLPPSSNNRALPQYMRAYALWHAQSLELKEVAKLLRQPPLAKSTVAQYVLEAVRVEQLPYDAERLLAAKAMVMPSMQWRYKRIG